MSGKIHEKKIKVSGIKMRERETTNARKIRASVVPVILELVMAEPVGIRLANFTNLSDHENFMFS